MAGVFRSHKGSRKTTFAAHQSAVTVTAFSSHAAVTAYKQQAASSAGQVKAKKAKATKFKSDLKQSIIGSLKARQAL